MTVEVGWTLKLVEADDETLVTRDELDGATVDAGFEEAWLELGVEDENTEVMAEVRGAETVIDPDEEGTAELTDPNPVEAELRVLAEVVDTETTRVVLEEPRAVLIEEEALATEVIEAVGFLEMEEDVELKVREDVELETGIDEEVAVKEGVIVAPDEALDPVADGIDEVPVAELSWTVQVRTSWTAGCPFWSVTGVRTMVHVSVTGPLAVIRVVVVVNVRLPFFWRGCRGKACTGELNRREKNTTRKVS